MDLLLDAGLDLPGVRPPLVPGEAAEAWLYVLKFRRFFRHAYAVELDPQRLRENAERLDAAVGPTRGPIAAVVEVLRGRPGV